MFNENAAAAKATILYTSADASPQSGAFRSLLSMRAGIKARGFRSLLVTASQERELTFHLLDESHDVFFLELPKPELNLRPNYILRYLLQNIRAIYQLFRIIKRERVHIVHVNEVTDFYGGIAARLAGVPCIWHVRADFGFASILQKTVPHIVIRLATMILVVSDSVKQRMFIQQGFRMDKIRVLHNPGPDFSQFHPNVDGRAIRDEFEIGQQAPLIVLVAKLIEIKGHEIFIRAARSVIDSFPNARFMIVGGELPGAHHQQYAEKMKRLPSELGIEDKVIFTGFRTDVPEFMAAADLVVHCSTFADPFPGVILQGMAMGKPVIAARHGGATEQIEHHVSGILVEPEDPAALAVAIRGLLENEEQRRCLGESAAAHVRREFTTENFFETLARYYIELIKLT